MSPYFKAHLRDAQYHYENWLNCQNDADTSVTKRGRSMARMQQSLCAAQDIGDEKLQVVNQLQELIDTKTRQLEQDQQALDYGKDSQIGDGLPKECRPITPALASPIHANAPISAAFAMSTNATTPTASLSAAAGAAATITSAGDRFSATANNSASGSVDRPAAKRARRTRNDNSGTNTNATTSGSGIEVVGASISDAAQLLENQSKQLLSATTQSSNTGQKKSGNTGCSGSGGGGGAGGSGGGGVGGGGKKKKRKSGRQTNASTNAQAAASSRDTRDETPPVEEAIDPDEPTYCLCDQISFGEMILCDNDLCPIEWFHFSCVSLMSKPKGKWFCPNCRGERPNVMKPKAQFLKELALYNKEKEEKT